MSDQEASSGGPMLSRGAFLATGASAVVGASRRAAAAEHPGSYLCGKTCPPEEEKWAIPAGILNTFWSDVYPRIVAEYWQQGGKAAVSTFAAWSNPMFEVATSQPAAGTTASWPGFPTGVGAWKGSSHFLSRLQRVHDYLALPSNTIPIRIVGEGEFDFILSDAGLELFIPPQPVTKRDLVRYYTFRGTGRRAIGLPSYPPAGDSGLASGMSTDSPTGPSQILMMLQNLDVILGRFHPEMQDCVAAVIACLRQTHSVPPTEIERLILDGVLDAATARRDQPAYLSLEEYACAVRPLRCWQLTGSVYRAIMTELPRVVAEMWMEHEDGVAGADDSYTRYITSSGPRRRYLDLAGNLEAYMDLHSGDNDSGVRRVFRERLETSLPGEREMRFRTYIAPYDNELRAPAGGIGLNWVDGDVMITNRGIFLPPVPTRAPELKDMFKAIKEGRAGNPVFTDSVMCE